MIRNGKTLTHPGSNSLGWGLASENETLDELEREEGRQAEILIHYGYTR